MRTRERGEGLVETIVSVAIGAVVCAALFGAIVALTHHFASETVKDALARTTRSELRVAADLLKYRGDSITPRSIATTIPLPSASPLAIGLSITTTASATGTIVTVTASSDTYAASVTASETLPQPVPAPSSNVPAPLRASAPL